MFASDSDTGAFSRSLSLTPACADAQRINSCPGTFCRSSCRAGASVASFRTLLTRCASLRARARSRATMPKEHSSLPVTLKGAWFISSGGSLAMDVVVHKVGDDGENIGQVRRSHHRGSHVRAAAALEQRPGRGRLHGTA